MLTVDKLGNGSQHQDDQRCAMSRDASQMHREHEPLALLRHERDEQLALCDTLEEIADQLGGAFDVRLCRSAAIRLKDQLPIFHRDEEIFYEILFRDRIAPPMPRACIEQAILDHRRLEDYALSVAEELQALSVNRSAENLGAFGFELRGLFDGLRQHGAWEEITLRGAIDRPLSATEINHFRAGIAVARRNLRGRPRLADPRD